MGVTRAEDILEGILIVQNWTQVVTGLGHEPRK